MSTDTESLRDLYLDVVGRETLTETQKESPSHALLDEDDSELEAELSMVLREDGLDDAVDGAEIGAGMAES